MSTTPTYTGEETRSSAEIESGIQTTRARMDNTLDELGNRLNPRSLVNSAMDWWESKSGRDGATGGVKKGYQSLVSHVKHNPVPALLIGAGAAWLFLRSEDDSEPVVNRRYGYQPPRRVGDLDFGDPPPSTDSKDSGEPGILDKLKEKAEDAKDSLAGIVDSAKEKAGGVADSLAAARDKVQDWYGEGQRAGKEAGHSLEARYDGAVEEFRKGLEHYPLAIGAGFLALGALVGVILPSTRKEDRLMGDQADSLREAAVEKKDELLEEGKAVATELGERALEEARQHGLTPENAGEKLTEVAEKAGEVIRKAAGEAGDAVKDKTAEA